MTAFYLPSASFKQVLAARPLSPCPARSTYKKSPAGPGPSGQCVRSVSPHDFFGQPPLPSSARSAHKKSPAGPGLSGQCVRSVSPHDFFGQAFPACQINIQKEPGKTGPFGAMRSLVEGSGALFPKGERQAPTDPKRGRLFKKTLFTPLKKGSNVNVKRNGSSKRIPFPEKAPEKGRNP